MGTESNFIGRNKNEKEGVTNVGTDEKHPAQ